MKTDKSFEMVSLSISGRVVLVDEEDGERVLGEPWGILKSREWAYVAIRRRGKPVRLLHRELIGAPGGKWVDHKNGNTLDNRKANLRICSPSENARNRRQERGAVSRFKGVSRHSPTRWKAQIQVDGKHIYLGVFRTEEEAAGVYNAAAARLFGEFDVRAR